ncbi:hypothetical protein SK128_020116 [Halocaridina rubra]|uniref:C2H2-type domain-containing protein n=1 Tax=Halocaridina rubra TaxID=373956 RepID=A0AAN9AEC4_HALRR
MVMRRLYGSHDWVEARQLSGLAMTRSRGSRGKDTRLHRCSYCNYVTKRRANLQRHRYKHTGEKPFACPYCDHKCADQSNLQTHIFRHTGEKPYTCPYCPYKAIQKRHLDIHTLKHVDQDRDDML